MSEGGALRVDGQIVEQDHYLRYHRERIRVTLATLARRGARRVIELGAHPWVMTAALIDDPRFEVAATVSAEEITAWPDDIGVRVSPVEIVTPAGREARFPNYSANVERTLFDVEAPADAVIASEIVEHLIRAPHVMFLNANRWLSPGGTLLVTTPNGAQFSNPFRRRSPSPALRANAYERHACFYTLGDLADLIGLCGFRISEAGYWDVYPRAGLPVVYDLLARIPVRYFQDKFRRTIAIVAEKVADVTELERCPRIYDPRGRWEWIASRGGP